MLNEEAAAPNALSMTSTWHGCEHLTRLLEPQALPDASILTIV